MAADRRDRHGDAPRAARQPDAAAIEGLLRECAPRALAAVARRFGDFADAEDAVQEAMIDAARQWPAQGVPENPTGWLVHVASRRMTDRIRSEAARRRREREVAADRSRAETERGRALWRIAPQSSTASPESEDDSLLLLFMCCHPALSPPAATALTLRAVGGLTTAEIAAAFLVPEPTMGQRISRAKQAIKRSGEPFAPPADAERAARLRAVLHVLYLIFNEGYLASGGAELARADLSDEAIRLARLAHAALPGEPEATGLLALMLLTDARRPARTGPRGEIVPLEDQDRSLWDPEQIAAGTALLREALAAGAVGEYQLQAAIAAEHDRAARPEDTDWREILGLYGLLERVTGNPMVTLNRAIATAMADGPAAGLELLDGLGERLGDHHRLHATRAHLLEMSGDAAAALAEYRLAAERTASLPERDYLTLRAARLNERSG